MKIKVLVVARALLFLLIFCAQAVRAQQVVTATVRDRQTNEPLPFCSIGVKGGTRGTLTNPDGVFQLSVFPADTLVVSYIGYQALQVPASGLQNKGSVYLQPSGKALAEVVVLHKPKSLYALLGRCRSKLLAEKEQTARVYFTLETDIDNQPVEVLECYYNGRLTNAGVESLALKNGRVALAEHEQEYFVNLNTSKAFSYLNLARAGSAMPYLPLQFGKRKMQELFTLQLVGALPENPRVQQIAFTPEQPNGRYFTGELWINEETAELVQITLVAEQAAQHPFLPLFPTDSVYRVALNITQTFRQGQLEHMQFNYRLKQQLNRTRNGTQTQREKEFSSRGMVYVTDYGSPFQLPFFEYDASQTDYRKISFLPYNPAFWEHNSSLVLTERQEQKLQFFEREGLLLNFRNFTNSRQKPLFEHNYAFWSDTARISFQHLPADNLRQKTVRENTVPAELYNLHVQLYLDVHEHNGNLYHQSATVFDPFQTFYYLPQNPYTRCFLNIYFDLCEIERRKLEAELQQKPHNLAQLQAAYRNCQARMHIQTRQFCQETAHGKNLPALKRWNALVLKQLGIDNLKLLGPKYELAAPN